MSARTRERMPMRARATPMKLMILYRVRRKMHDRAITIAMVKLSSSWDTCEGVEREREERYVRGVEGREAVGT